ncbi:hypothetical protein EV182_003895 [Spiromyces aspiralis]|uniref:Uncharacterized protein n=1 Tax=Spiromyces aspiralis TaxID=68401 RepID=A0ACC1HD73_9FUNG|nr:hypothetical protein EV182_003895 [Spiromyces aspiralis]
MSGPTAAAAVSRQQHRLLAVRNFAILFPFLAVLILGTLFRVASPGATGILAATPAPTLSIPPPPPFLANKRNILNRYFAKVAWGWTSLLFAPFLAFIYSYGVPAQRRPYAVATAAARYVLATLYWYALTQWAFGPSVFDRVYMYTGGYCKFSSPDKSLTGIVTTTTSQQCRRLGGSWTGGFDISGHCFLLIHSALFLWEETIRPYCAFRKYAVPASTRSGRGTAKIPGGPLFSGLVMAIITLLGLWMLVLFGTAMYFHKTSELVVGTLFGVAYWVGVYFVLLPRLAFHSEPGLVVGAREVSQTD